MTEYQRVMSLDDHELAELRGWVYRVRISMTHQTRGARKQRRWRDRQRGRPPKLYKRLLLAA